MDNLYIRTNLSNNYAEMGGKAGAFAKLAQWQFEVPDWIVLVEEAFLDSLSEQEKSAYLNEILSYEQVERMSVNHKVMASLESFFSKHESGRRYAVRSSAKSEDGTMASFAGQYDSVLNVEKSNIESAIKKVWCSAFSEHIRVYRKENGLSGLYEMPAVLIQLMVASESAGVAFASDPVTGDSTTAVVSAVYGLGSALVSGECDADVYTVKTGLIVDKHIALKEKFQQASLENEAWADVPHSLQQLPVLSETQILEVTQLANEVSWKFGKSMDIEWAYEAGKLYLLQARPITAMGYSEKPDGLLNIWDNSNIAESYGGITSPLTFSFIIKAYEAAYRQMCVLLHVPKNRMMENELVYSQMLGIMNGRVYYNLISWYKVLAMLPGYQFNRSFMEQMMGVKAGVPESVLGKSKEVTTLEKSKDFLGLVISALSLVKSYIFLPRQTELFYHRLDNVLGEKDLKALDLDGLVSYYRDLEKSLLTKWDAPLINDFFAMIFYGVLKKLSEKWCSDDTGTLHNDLLCGMGDIISAQPAKRIQSMAKNIAYQEEIVNCFCEGNIVEINETLRKEKDLSHEIELYIKEFGNRCLDELKLESDTLHELPMPLYRSIGAFARLIRNRKGIEERHEEKIRSEAEAKVADLLSQKPLKQAFLMKIAKSTRRLVSGRENLRFERTRLFGRVRDIVLHMGYILASQGHIESQKDVFYLEMHELLGFSEGTATTKDLKGLIAVRKKEAEKNADKPYFERFETHGAVGLINAFKEEHTEVELPTGNSLKGLGCCPGKIKGHIRIIKDPRGAMLKQGEILVAERTDPGWIMLFPAAAGILVERGSLLSHAAIVAREMGIPAVVGLSGLTEWLNDGDLVSFDGATGVVTKL